MHLKRVFDEHAPKEKWVPRLDAAGQEMHDENGERIMIPPVVPNVVEVLHAGLHQHFSPDMVFRGGQAGWLVSGGGKLTVRGVDGAITYKVVRVPGYYCCHCKAPMDDGLTARAHLAEKHAGEKSPDPSNPSGYERINYYDCVRE